MSVEEPTSAVFDDSRLVAGDQTALEPSAQSTVPWQRRVRRWFYHRLVRLLMLAHNTALALAKGFGRRPQSRTPGRGYQILLTGRFGSENWAMAFLRPLAASHLCKHLTVISTYPLPPIANVTTVHPPAWLLRMLGATLARLLVFVWTALWRRPDIVGGFHIKVNALVAAVLAPLIGARAIYVCVGGPTEVLDGGIWGEGTFFEGMETPDATVEKRLLRSVAACDAVITMGTRAAAFFRSQGVPSCIHVVPGGIDMSSFSPGWGEPSTDLVFLGRLVEVKRVDLFLEVVARVAKRLPNVKAAIIGDGPLRQTLEGQTRDLGIWKHVTFIGFAPDVGDCLRRMRIFVLTSHSEGLALSLMEAMTCGLPAVVANVGDLGDLVADGVNGYLVTERSPEAFASRIVDLLTDSAKYAAFSLAARRSALRYETAAAVRRWDDLLARLAQVTQFKKFCPVFRAGNPPGGLTARGRRPKVDVVTTSPID